MVMGMWLSSIFPLLLLVGGRGNDLLDYVQTDAYWRLKGVAATVDRLTAELSPPKGADLSQLIPQLGADDAKVRRAASAKIRALGSAAVPQLKEASRNADPEIAMRAKELLEEATNTGHDSTVRRLMAIRTLGEIGKPEALPALKEALPSKDLFVADYAAAAIARIEQRQQAGEGAKGLPPLVRPAMKAGERLDEVWLLPARNDVVAQMAFGGYAVPTLDQLSEPFDDAMLDLIVGGMQMDEVPHAENLTTRQKLITFLTAQVLKVVEKTGNIRIDSVTVGVYTNAPGAPGTTVVLLKGLYDPKAVVAAIKDMGKDEPGGSFKTVAGVDVFQEENGDHMALALVSPERAAVVIAERDGNLPLESVIEACKAGRAKEGLKDNAEMAALVKSVDTTASVWGVVKVTPALRQDMEPLAVFDTLRLTVHRKDDPAAAKSAYATLAVRFEGTGADAAKIKSTADEVTKGMKEGIEQAKQVVGQVPPGMAGLFKNAIDSMESVKVAADGGTLVGTATLQGPASAIMFPMLMAMPMRRAAAVQPVPAPTAVEDKPAAEGDKKDGEVKDNAKPPKPEEEPRPVEPKL